MSRVHTTGLQFRSFVHKDMYRDLQTGLNMEKATCTFLHLASTSSSVPQVVVTILSSYVKTVTCSKPFPLHMIYPAFDGARILISLVLDAFTFNSVSLLLECLKLLPCVIFWLSKTRSSANTKSSSFSSMVNCFPVLFSP